ncbi:DUF3624 family protein [Vibrio sp. V27_P1S3P104]|uniref:DUF3624 domain-containing protein n=1 Tax=Vibrio TaxID=662 RepID=UPI000C16F4EA|nr:MULTISPECIES: DUF3624 domain-containing protein [Vibrio]NAW67900.1 DUF3624 family protein [Vibrio sp. V28_P6S34P95]NAX05907.1 DUF3624 family protein [Vibrio sp. V30_P3S12P165]NAX33959.1 DUF3624 family protein [Vibrio sp. V29_P1S30P107]NAX37728.1 DUF3624 family protein [Vibrio sp. V27_P1S3P104]NAX41261.1 DUF3624 family protein [Vibrio sp. V26_P1S5P106]
MTCNDCREHWFWKKIGRCQRCMDQLTLFSVACWVIWFWLFRDEPRSIGSISLLFAGFAFNGLLFLHLWMKFVVLPWRKRQTKKP